MPTITKQKANKRFVYIPEHPLSNRGFILEERMVMENFTGRILDKDEVVFHIDGHTLNNHIDNLDIKERNELTTTYSEMKCPQCSSVFTIPRHRTYYWRKTQYTCCCAECSGKMKATIAKHGMGIGLKNLIETSLIREFDVKISR